MNDKERNNLKIIYGIDLIIFGIVLALHLSKVFDFNKFWCLFLVVPSIVDIALNKLNVFNGALLLISAPLLSYFVSKNFWVPVVVLVILVGVLLLVGKYLKPKEEKKDA